MAETILGNAGSQIKVYLQGRKVKGRSGRFGAANYLSQGQELAKRILFLLYWSLVQKRRGNELRNFSSHFGLLRVARIFVAEKMRATMCKKMQPNKLTSLLVSYLWENDCISSFHSAALFLVTRTLMVCYFKKFFV